MRKSLKTRLRLRFVVLAMLCLFVIESIITAVSIFQNYNDLVTKSDILLSQLHSNPSSTSRYFSVKIPQGKDTAYPDAVQHVSITPEEAAALTHRVLAKDRDKGFIDSYRYHIYRNESGTKIYFLYRESAIDMYKAATENMILVNLICFLGVSALLIPVSAWIVKPLVENHKKQKRFITAAGHELKTPLTVISTNVQLLETEIGKNQWLEGIQNQVAHLTKMTCDLVTLSKAEEFDAPLHRESFSFGSAFREILDVYQILADRNHIRTESTIPEHLVYNGSRREVQQLLRILLDNACKYCPQGGVLRITAKKSLPGVRLVVENTTDSPTEEDPQALVNRFSRGKNAEHRPGFGLGLSIAEAIAARHNGHLLVNAENNTFRVEVVLR